MVLPPGFEPGLQGFRLPLADSRGLWDPMSVGVVIANAVLYPATLLRRKPNTLIGNMEPEPGLLTLMYCTRQPSPFF